MSKVLVEESTLQDIAERIREKNPDLGKMYPWEMPFGIIGIDTEKVFIDGYKVTENLELTTQYKHEIEYSKTNFISSIGYGSTTEILNNGNYFLAYSYDSSNIGIGLFKTDSGNKNCGKIEIPITTNINEIIFHQTSDDKIFVETRRVVNNYTYFTVYQLTILNNHLINYNIKCSDIKSLYTGIIKNSLVDSTGIYVIETNSNKWFFTTYQFDTSKTQLITIVSTTLNAYHLGDTAFIKANGKYCFFYPDPNNPNTTGNGDRDTSIGAYFTITRNSQTSFSGVQTFMQYLLRDYYSSPIIYEYNNKIYAFVNSNGGDGGEIYELSGDSWVKKLKLEYGQNGLKRTISNRLLYWQISESQSLYQNIEEGWEDTAIRFKRVYINLSNSSTSEVYYSWLRTYNDYKYYNFLGVDNDNKFEYYSINFYSYDDFNFSEYEKHSYSTYYKRIE